MFAEYLNAGGNWLESEMYLKAVQLQQTNKQGREVLQLSNIVMHFGSLANSLVMCCLNSGTSLCVSQVYTRFMDLVAQEGEEAAKAIRDRKRELQKIALPTDDPWIMKHPELPGNEAGLFLHEAFARVM